MLVGTRYFYYYSYILVQVSWTEYGVRSKLLRIADAVQTLPPVSWMTMISCPLQRRRTSTCSGCHGGGIAVRNSAVLKRPTACVARTEQLQRVQRLILLVLVSASAAGPLICQTSRRPRLDGGRGAADSTPYEYKYRCSRRGHPLAQRSALSLASKPSRHHTRRTIEPRRQEHTLLRNAAAAHLQVRGTECR